MEHGRRIVDPDAAYLLRTPTRLHARFGSTIITMMMLMQHSLRQWTPRVVPLAVRSLGGLSKKSPGSDPLDILMKECLARNLCDVQGGRMPGVHWVFSIAIAHDDPNKVRVVILELNLMQYSLTIQHSHPSSKRLAFNAYLRPALTLS